MKAIKEIGLKKGIKFVFLTIGIIVFKMMIFPSLRVIFLRLLGVKVGKDVIIHEVRFYNYYRRGFKGMKIGNNCFIGNYVLLDLADEVIIADNVTISERAFILTHSNVGYRDHPLQKHFPSFSKPVVLKEGCFVGADSLLLPGVTVGECAFIAAGSVVTKDVAPYTLAGGVPAKFLRKISEEE